MLQPVDVYYDLLSSLTELHTITKFFGELSNAECALLSFLFLPILLLAWLILLRMFNIGDRVKKIFFVIVSISYFILVFYLKYETNNKLKLYNTRNKIVFEMLYRNKIKYPVSEIQNIGLKKWEILRAADRYGNYFHLTSEGEASVIMIIKEEVIDVIRQRETDLVNFIGTQGMITVDSLLHKLGSDLDYGAISKEDIELLARKNPDKIKLDNIIEVSDDSIRSDN